MRTVLLYIFAVTILGIGAGFAVFKWIGIPVGQGNLRPSRIVLHNLSSPLRWHVLGESILVRR